MFDEVFKVFLERKKGTASILIFYLFPASSSVCGRINVIFFVGQNEALKHFKEMHNSREDESKASPRVCYKSR